MTVGDYTLLKKTLNLSVAINWLYEDSKDDFFLDPFVFRDIRAFSPDYIEQRQHRIFQVDVIPSIMEYSPKANGMLREAIWLHPTHRIIYLAILHQLLPKLDKLVPPAIYSYRLDTPDEPDTYPFPNRTDRWKQFQNDFRSAALEESTNAVVLTDLAAFYDHISIDKLIERIEVMLGRSVGDETQMVIQFLRDLLNLWSTTGYGIPQNYDPSSFFGSLYLYNVDADILGKRYRYFRWVDDIRICAKNRDQAVRSLHDLQRALARERLFLASDKTKIIEKGTKEFEELLDVEDDVIISEAEESIATCDSKELLRTADILLERLKIKALPTGDDRKFRAYANRLMSIADFEEVADKIHPVVRAFVLPRLRSHPSRSDYWVKMLLPILSEEVMEEANNLLVTRPSLFDWQRYYLWKMLTHAPTLPSAFLEFAKSTARIGVSTLEKAQAILCVGRHGTNTEREQLFAEHFSTQTMYPVQRALIASIQELPNSLRDKFFDRALRANSDHKQFVAYLLSLEKPHYGERPRHVRHCLEEPRKGTSFLKSGVGLVRGRKTKFRLSRSHYDYE